MASEESVPANLRYRISSKPIGRGSYADVYYATSRDSGQEVALKRALNGQQAKARIKREIAAQKELAHPNIMPIWDNDPGHSWYTMPLANGTLYDLKSDLDEEELASVLLNLAEGLDIGISHLTIS